MEENMQNKRPLWDRLKEAREKYLPYNEKTIRRLVIAMLIMYAWVLIWALVFKIGNETILRNLYTNLKDFTLKERILWDIVPFNYRGEGEYKRKIILDTVLNCFVMVPGGVMLCYIFKKPNVLRDAAICLGISVLIESLQLITMLGNPATEDLITNTIGYFIGFGLYMLLFRRLSHKGTVIVALAADLIFAAVSVYALISTISIADLLYQFITKTL